GTVFDQQAPIPPFVVLAFNIKHLNKWVCHVMRRADVAGHLLELMRLRSAAYRCAAPGHGRTPKQVIPKTARNPPGQYPADIALELCPLRLAAAGPHSSSSPYLRPFGMKRLSMANHSLMT